MWTTAKKKSLNGKNPLMMMMEIKMNEQQKIFEISIEVDEEKEILIYYSIRKLKLSSSSSSSSTNIVLLSITNVYLCFLLFHCFFFDAYFHLFIIIITTHYKDWGISLSVMMVCSIHKMALHHHSFIHYYQFFFFFKLTTM